jgi:four helix bundle protein
MTNAEFNEIFRNRTQDFAVAVLKFLAAVPFNSATKVMSTQLAKSATSTAANYRAFCRGRSRQEMYAKICIVVEEADETVFWLELFLKTGFGEAKELESLLKEGMEITKITSKTKSTLGQKD